MKLRFGDIVLIEIPFVDKQEIKLRPALVLFEEYNNVVVAGITSNLKMEGILIEKKEGLLVDSVLKLNYIFTISKTKVRKILTHLSEEKKREVCKILFSKFNKCKKLLLDTNL